MITTSNSSLLMPQHPFGGKRVFAGGSDRRADSTPERIPAVPRNPRRYQESSCDTQQANS
jgi:hypothetical protein